MNFVQYSIQMEGERDVTNFAGRIGVIFSKFKVVGIVPDLAENLLLD